ncbi:MAG: DUF3488 and transglutaminase-like domain-containing protein [Proteobacteria bacterium]|nr:DUF3488 and transglutaminase-like domain-containing protein [Pseudomonadota bacterium]
MKNTVSQLSRKQLVWIVLAVLIAVIPQIPRMPMWFVPMVILVVFYRFYAEYRKINRMYNVVLALISILTLMLIFYTHGLGLSRELSVTVLVTMTVLKLLESYRMRDALLIVVLSYFVIMTRFLYSQDVSLVVFLLLSVFASTHALRVLEYQGGDAWFVKKDMRSTFGMMLMAVPFAALFFVAFPRIGSPIWGSPDIFGEGTSGISDEMSPGTISQLFLDDSPAFRVSFSGEIPDNADLYWRGPVLWNYDGKTWTRKKHRKSRQQIIPSDSDKFYSYDVELESTGQNYIFGLDYVTRPVKGAFLLPDSVMYAPDEINQLKHYSLVSVLLDRFPDKLSAHDAGLLLAYPQKLNKKTQSLMQAWRAQAVNEVEFVNRVLNWFREDEFYYTFNPPLLDGDVVDQFLFDTKKGFCEHYASSFVLMMRMAGIPSRVVTGYQGGIDNGGYLLVKQSDAHAWAEVYLSDNAWHRIDPTTMVSPQRVESGSLAIMTERRTLMDFNWLRSARNKMDAVKYKWNRWIRDYNVEKQQALYERVGFKQIDGRAIAII